MKKQSVKISEFNYDAGNLILGKYEIIDKLGAGWEGEVYKIKEVKTKIERTAKIFFPHKNVKNKAYLFYAKKLHKLRKCQMVIHYHNEETIYIEGIPITILISEYVEGELLTNFINSFPSKKLRPYMALHLLYSLAKGIEEIHLLNEYHGDLHMDNVIVNRFGLAFELKLIDMFHWGAPTKANRNFDICSLIRMFYDSLGGARNYSKLPQDVKSICCGLKETLILKKFHTASQLREHLEKLCLTNSIVK